jgi:hypothetical protein
MPVSEALCGIDALLGAAAAASPQAGQNLHVDREGTEPRESGDRDPNGDVKSAGYQARC